MFATSLFIELLYTLSKTGSIVLIASHIEGWNANIGHGLGAVYSVFTTPGGK